MKENLLIAIDPGSDKTGVAVLTYAKELVMMRIIQTQDVEASLLLLIEEYPQVDCLVCGDGTHHAQFVKVCNELITKHALSLTVHIVDEYRSTEEARFRYWDVHPRRGWRRLVPRSFLYPPEPVDDITAWIIGERYLDSTV